VKIDLATSVMNVENLVDHFGTRWGYLVSDLRHYWRTGLDGGFLACFGHAGKLTEA
jgi:hypothetical protein